MTTSVNQKPHRPLATAHQLIYDGDAAGFRGYLHMLYDSGCSGQEEAGEMLYEFTCKHGTDFVKQLLETAPTDAEAVRLIRFLTEHYFPRFPQAPDSRRLLSRVYLLYKNLAVATFQALQTDDSAQTACMACDVYAGVQDAATSVGRIGIRSARSKSVEILETQADRNPNRAVQMALAQAYKQLADCCCTDGSKAGVGDGMKYYEKALRLYSTLDDAQSTSETRRGLAEALERTADLLCRDYAQGSMKLAEPLYQRALELRKSDTQPLPLAHCYGQLGRLYVHRTGAGCRGQAIAMYGEQETLLQTLYTRQPDVELAGELANCRMALGDLYAIGAGETDCVTAFRFYKGAAALRLECMQALRTKQSGMAYAHARYAMAQMLWQVGGEENLNAALSGMELVAAFLEKQQETGEWDDPDLMSRCQLFLYGLEEKLWLKHPLERLRPEFNPLYPQAYAAAEALEALSLMPEEGVDRIAPIHRMELQYNALPLYRPHLKSGVPLGNQHLQPQTVQLLKYLLKQ